MEKGKMLPLQINHSQLGKDYEVGKNGEINYGYIFPKIGQHLFMRGLKARACQRAEDMPRRIKKIIIIKEVGNSC